MDRLTKYVHFIPLSHPYSVAKVAGVYMQYIFNCHVLPTTVVSDRVATFTSNFYFELFILQGVELAMSIAYHPQFDGQTEIVNKSLEQYLRAFVGDKPHKWVEWLPLVEYWFNTNFHTAIKLTPVEALYGYSPQKLQDYIPGTTKVNAVDSFLTTKVNAASDNSFWLPLRPI